MIEKALVALLRAHPGVSAIVGDRVKPLQLDRDPTLPAITYQRISTPRELDHGGDQGYTDFRVQLNCWAKRTQNDAGYVQAKELAEQVRLALNGYRGTVNGTVVGRVQIVGDRDEIDPERSFERVSVDALGAFQEVKPT